jgi:hypothetical protein
VGDAAVMMMMKAIVFNNKDDNKKNKQNKTKQNKTKQNKKKYRGIV